MKDYQEVADRVFQRSEEIIAENRRKKKARIKAGSLASCFCLAALLGFGAWRSGVFPQENLASAEQFAEGGDDSGASDVVPENGNSDLDGNPNDPDVIPKYDSDGSDAAAGFMMPMMPDDRDGSFEMPEVTRMISSYGDGDTEACYEVPENGTVGLSSPLSGAIAEYGDCVRYRVFVDLFRNGQALEMNSSLMEQESDRLAALGYGVAGETYFDGTSNHYYFTLHATRDQVINFAASEEYGYMLFLYNERVPSSFPDGEEPIFANIN